METKEKKHDEKHHEKDHKSAEKQDTKANKDFESMTKDELYELAKERDIQGKSDMNKEQLIQALKGAEDNDHNKNSHETKIQDKKQEGSHGKEKEQHEKNHIKIESNNKHKNGGDSDKKKQKSSEKPSKKSGTKKGEGETSWWKKIFS